MDGPEVGDIDQENQAGDQGEFDIATGGPEADR